jgi:molybdate transport system permease protein
MDIGPILLSLRLALCTSVILLVVGTPLAAFLAYGRFPGKAVLSSLLTLPIAIPPTVIGFYMLLFLSPYSPVGKFLAETIGLKLIFSFQGLVFASVIYSLPFFLGSVRTAMERVDSTLLEASHTLGKGSFATFMHVSLPLSLPGMFAGFALSFAHTLGEFGVVLMVGGNLPGETRTMSIELYEKVEQSDFASANAYALLLIGVSVASILFVHALERRAKAVL